MKNHENDEVCIRCGQEYGNHQWVNDACPTKSSIEYINGSRAKPPLIVFNPFRRFKPGVM
jgi:hypothetical protein